MPSRVPRVIIGLAAFEVVDAVAGSLAPRRFVQSHLDHLGVPNKLRPVLPVIKVASAAGLLLGAREPRLGAFTSAALVAYYAAAARFHLLANDHPVLALPAVAAGAVAAVILLERSRV